MTTRRHALALLAAAPFAPAACAQPLADPAAGWRDPGAGEADPRRFALAHAILAANPHNTQPWLVEFDGEDGMTLYCDLDRRLPFTDPLDRQITLGCGGFLELYALAASSRGLRAEITAFPEGAPSGRLDARPLAHVRLIADAAAADPLFAAIVQRRTNRNPYAAAPPSEAALNAVLQASGADNALLTAWSEVETARVAQIRDLVWRAFDREMRTRGAQEETYNWLRLGREERARHRDGLFIDVPVPGLLRAIGMLDRDDLLNPESSANRQASAEWREKAMTAPAFMGLRSAEDAPATRLAAGRAYARMNLAATAAGLAIHPWSQALQEYEEMKDLYDEARVVFGVSGGETLQMLVRVGHAAPVEAAARRAMNDFVRNEAR